MLKFLITLLLSIIVILGAVLLYVNLYGAEYASSYLSNLLKQPVSIGKVEISWHQVSMKSVDIKNSDSSPIPSSFKADLVRLKIEPLNLLKDDIYIEEIEIDRPVIGLTMENLTGSENNWEKILNILFSPNAAAASKKKVIIDTLLVLDLSIQANHQLLGPYTVILPIIPQIKVENLTANTPLAIAEAINVLFRAILAPISEKGGFSHILNNVEELPPSVKSIFSHQETIIDEENKNWDKLKDGLNHALNEIENIFK